jgi:hypothetical protein
LLLINCYPKNKSGMYVTRSKDITPATTNGITLWKIADTLTPVIPEATKSQPPNGGVMAPNDKLKTAIIPK